MLYFVHESSSNPTKSFHAQSGETNRRNLALETPCRPVRVITPFEEFIFNKKGIWLVIKNSIYCACNIKI